MNSEEELFAEIKMNDNKEEFILFRRSKERRERQRAFIVANWKFFEEYFSESRWKLWQLRGRFKTTEVANISFDFELIGEILRAEFRYSPRTYFYDIIVHFKRIYEKENQKTRNACVTSRKSESPSKEA